ncbi:MAG: septation protein SpoVG family protein [Nitrospinaceae bacterium]
MIKITEVKIYPFDTGEEFSNIRAYAEVTLEDCLILRGIRILQSKQGGLFLGFPARKGRDNEYHDLIIAKSPEFKTYLRDRVIQAYKEYT